MSVSKDQIKRSHSKPEGITVEQVKSFGVRGILDRGITKETCEYFGVMSEFSQVSGSVIAHYFPVTKNGKVTGYLKRDLTKPKKDAFSTVGDVSVEHELVGQHVMGQGRKLFICEGQYDYLSLYQALFTNKSNTGKYRPSVVTIGLGTANAAEHIANNLDWVNKYSEIITVFDNDVATDKERKEGIIKGQDAVASVALVLPELNNSVLELNDPSDYLQAGRSEDLYKEVMFNSKPFEHDNIVYGAGDLEDIMTPLGEGVKVLELPKLMNKLGEFRPGELSIVLAPPKTGKTSFCKLLNYSFLKQNVKTLGIYLEESLKKTRQSFIAMDNNVHLPYFRQDPSIIPRDKVEKTMTDLLNPDKAMFLHDGKGHITPDKLLDILKWANIKGCKIGIVDHLSFVISGSRGKDERKEIDNMLTDIAAFCKSSQMHIIAVAHITRDKNKPKPKNQDGSIKYPYWYEVDETDGRGSGAFEQVCSNLIVLDKQIKEDKSRGLTRAGLVLNREFDRTGHCDYLTVDNHSGRMVVTQGEEI